MDNSFTIILMNTDIERRLSIPLSCTKALAALRGGGGGGAHQRVKLMVKYGESEEKWTFVYSIRGRDNTKVDFIEGWQKFVYAKNLQPGDVIKFCSEPEVSVNNGVPCKIEVKRMSLDRWTC